MSSLERCQGYYLTVAAARQDQIGWVDLDRHYAVLLIFATRFWTVLCWEVLLWRLLGAIR